MLANNTQLLLQGLVNQPIQNTIPIEQITNNNSDLNLPKSKLFCIQDFINNIKVKSSEKNQNYIENSETMNAYDVAHQCIRIPYFRIKKYPVQNYENSWLPIEFRARFGNAAHDMLQDYSTTFTETEACLKSPSLRLSVRLDALINDDVVVEIKSCSYADYSKIINSRKPRMHDFQQAVLYKYLLENHLDEIKQQKPSRSGSIPKLDKYNIQHIQMIYICHELLSNNDESITSDVEYAKQLRRKLDSKNNPFWFITCLTINLNEFDVQPHVDHLKEKMYHLKYALDNDYIPPLNNKFIDSKSCFFCIYKQICSKY